MRLGVPLAFACLLFLLLAGCASHSGGSGGGVIVPGEYRLTRIDGEPYTGRVEVPLRVTEDRIGGKSPVNQWSASYEAGRLGPAVSTKMAGPPELMAIEAELFARLDGATIRASRDGNTVEVVQGGKVVLAFERVDGSPRKE